MASSDSSLNEMEVFRFISGKIYRHGRNHKKYVALSVAFGKSRYIVMKVKTSVSLSPKTHEALKTAARAERRSVSQYIEIFIETALPEVLKKLSRKAAKTPQ